MGYGCYCKKHLHINGVFSFNFGVSVTLSIPQEQLISQLLGIKPLIALTISMLKLLGIVVVCLSILIGIPCFFACLTQISIASMKVWILGHQFGKTKHKHQQCRQVWKKFWIIINCLQFIEWTLNYLQQMITGVYFEKLFMAIEVLKTNMK